MYGKNLRWFVNQVDLFGPNVTLNFQGSHKIRTVPGALLSIIFVILMVALIAETTIEVSHEMTTTINSDTYIDIDAEESAFYPFKHDFRIAVGYTEPIPESIGSFEA